MENPYDRNADLLEELDAAYEKLEVAHHRISRLEEDLERLEDDLELEAETHQPSVNRLAGKVALKS